MANAITVGLMKLVLPMIVVGVVLSLLSCSQSPSLNSKMAGTNQAKEERPRMDIKITSAVFQEGGTIPIRYTCDGEDVSPPLKWSGVPDGTKALALIVEDPDAPGKTWIHWVVYDLPAKTSELPESVTPQEKLANGAKQGLNDFKKIGYAGPCPPGGSHRYFFRVYSLAAETGLQGGATKDEVWKAIKGQILAQGALMGTYKR